MENKLRLKLILDFRYMEKIVFRHLKKKIKKSNTKNHEKSLMIKYGNMYYELSDSADLIDELSSIIRTLEQNGLITVRTYSFDYDDNNRTIYSIDLTSKGKKFLEDNHMRKYIF